MKRDGIMMKNENTRICPLENEAIYLDSPNIITGEDEPEREPIGVWGQRHLNYIQKHCKHFYNKMLSDHTLYDYLLQLDKDAEDMFNRLVKQIAEREGITEQLKASNQLEWVARINNIRSRATEVVNNEVIYI